ncbi:MAG: hypothetical protein NDI82_11110 [Anaeromyxobacteraceae bacterium]|nr:hypothetical protein [Anaeromyxobacteraceae bacterium]
MRLSKPRLLLRAALLLVLAAFMAWRALETGRTAAQPGLEPGGAQMLSRIALVEWVLAGLALLTAGGVLFALRRRPRAHSLHLGEQAPADRRAPGGPEGPPAA